MSAPTPALSRRLLPWVVGIAFFVVTVMASWRIVALRDSTIAREKEELQVYLQDQVTQWEDELFEDLADRLDIIAQDPTLARGRQQWLRKHRPWFNSLYVWQAPGQPQGPSRPGAKAHFVFPVPASEPTHRLLERTPCLQRAKWMAQDPSIDPIQAAAAYEVGCSRESTAVRLIAAMEAAYLLDVTGQLHLADQALDSAGIPDALTLTEAVEQGLPPDQVALFRIARANIDLGMGREQSALDQYYRVGIEIVSLDAPDAAASLSQVEWPILMRLRRHQRFDEAKRLRALYERAERRLVAYREIAERILPRRARPNEPPRFIFDQYSNAPYLLFYGWGRSVGVALQLEQSMLLKDFLERRIRRSRRSRVTITDASGKWVAGAKRGGELAMVVPFSRTLTHLRVGYRQAGVDAELATVDDQWIVSLVVLLVCTLLGFGALYVWVRASWQQAELMSRQRAFTTRVTHELKTPLAGIRVMAENLEAGAFRDGTQRAEMARRIMDEADKLTQRVDEVLAVARERTIPDPVVFDPEEVLYEVIDQWGPRYEDAGVTFVAELDPTEMVKGDPVALRDAVSCLVDNALKYRREDHPTPKVWLRLHEEGRRVFVEVSDNGMGVPKAMRRSIFERFVRVEGPNRGKAGGHGLGLAQVAEIVRAHKGSITCVDGVDGGARFVVSLPAAAGS